MEFKDIVVDNDAIVNTEPKELPEEAHNIPQGVKPHLNPNPGYGEDGKTVPAIKTDLVEGERGTPVDVVTEPQTAFKSVQEVYNFLNGLKIKGKNLEEYIDSQGGVTEEELQDAVADLEEQIGAITSGTKLYKHTLVLTTGPVNYTYIIISTKELPYTGDKKVSELFNEAIKFYASSGSQVQYVRYSGPSVMITLNSKSGFNYSFYQLDGMSSVEGHYESSYTENTFSGNAFVSDTVTEL